MDEPTRKKRVLCPVEGKEGKTFWIRMGMAWVNKDNSINVYLDGLPVNGKLQIRDWDEEREGRRPSDGSVVPLSAARSEAQSEIPF